MKKERKTSLVLFTIWLLLLVIVLPPIFRATIPRNDLNKDTPEVKKVLTLLNCERQVPNSYYTISSRLKYINGVAERNIIVYTKGQTLNEAATTGNASVAATTKTPKEEITFFKSIADLPVTEADTKTTIQITKELLKDDSMQEALKDYLQKMSDQQKFYQNQGYRCSVMSS